MSPRAEIVRAPGRAIARADVTLEAGATQNIELTLQSGVRVRITMPVATEGSVELRDAQGVAIDWLWRSRDANAAPAASATGLVRSVPLRLSAGTSDPTPAASYPDDGGPARYRVIAPANASNATIPAGSSPQTRSKSTLA